MTAPTPRETADHAELARLAEAATPGEWRVAEDNNPFADGRHVFAKGLDGTDFVVLNLKTDHTFVTATSREQQQRNALFAAAANPATVLALLSEIAALRGERDEAQSAVEAWAHVCESLEAHLQDRVAMQDVANPERYLNILRSNMARVQKDSEQIRAARWADYRRGNDRATQAERQRDEAVGLLRGVHQGASQQEWWRDRVRAFLANQGADQ